MYIVRCYGYLSGLCVVIVNAFSLILIVTIHCHGYCWLSWLHRSLGSTVVEMVTGRPPWFEYEPTAAMFKIVMNDTKPNLPPHASSHLINFVELCFIK